jgi:hypothetical protein
MERFYMHMRLDEFESKLNVPGYSHKQYRIKGVACMLAVM